MTEKEIESLSVGALVKFTSDKGPVDMGLVCKIDQHEHVRAFRFEWTSGETSIETLSTLRVSRFLLVSLSDAEAPRPAS